jgi:hypothetical protein
MAMLTGALRSILICALAVFAAPAWADGNQYATELQTAKQQIFEGHVRECLDQLGGLLRRIDPNKEKDAYWVTATMLIEFLTQTENHALAGQVLGNLLSTKIAETNPAYFQRTQLNLGRNLAYTGNANDSEKVLRALTSQEARLVHNTNQRYAAAMLSIIELDKGKIGQAAIWIRRAVVGTLVDKGSGSEEIIDILAHYANYLARTRRPEAIYLFFRLAPIFDANLSHRSPKYLAFVRDFVALLSDAGNFPAADNVLKLLQENSAAVDIVAASVLQQRFFQELYQTARSTVGGEKGPIVDRLKEIVQKYPNFLDTPFNRIAFSFYAVLGNDIELAEQMNIAPKTSTPTNEQYAAYDVIIQSLIAARKMNFNESLSLIQVALEKINGYHRTFENESTNHLPALSIEERVVLGVILGAGSKHASTFEQADQLFQLEQFINRDKGKLGLNKRVARQGIGSDLAREDIRSRDRLRDLRERIMSEATDSLLERILPIRNSTTVKENDYSVLIRLEDIDDKIASTDQNVSRQTLLTDMRRDGPVALGDIRRVLNTNEALVVHSFVQGIGIVTTCVDSKDWIFNFNPLTKQAFQQLVVDEKLLTSLVHGAHAPSPVLDADFPIDSSHNLYRTFFGGIETCLANKTHILLATDPDIFSLPWNALLTSRFPADVKFQFRTAPWLARSYALSLLPSVRSLYELRHDVPPSRARERFLGVGDPDFQGTPIDTTQVSLSKLFSARGIGDRNAIANLPRLPESASELRSIAKVLNSPFAGLLLGPNATERELRKRPLNDYRIISFATHAVVAGEIEGLTEPALVLSPGFDDRNSANDGLLTATEIANLTLDANLVILSACNTAAPDGQASSRGLSGLADAFFFAGARSIAVTQWAVFTQAAEQIGSGLVSRSMQSNVWGVAEGLRRSMLDYVLNVPEIELQVSKDLSSR